MGGWDKGRCPLSSDLRAVTGEGTGGSGVGEEVDGVGEWEGGRRLRGCMTGKGDVDDIEERRGLGSAFRLSVLSSVSGRCSVAFKRS